MLAYWLSIVIAPVRRSLGEVGSGRVAIQVINKYQK